MRPATLLYFYARRLRTHPVQELLAGLGIAIGVALAFSVLVANASVVGSAAEITRGVTGSATLQLTSRDDHGFDARLVQRVKAIPGVERVAPVLEQRAVLAGANGRTVSVDLASMDGALASMSGRTSKEAVEQTIGEFNGVVLSKETARALGVSMPAKISSETSFPRLTVRAHGREIRQIVIAVLGADTIGPLGSARVALMSLRPLQKFAGVPGRITRILVDTKPNQDAPVRAALQRIAAGRSTVTAADAEVSLLEQATGASDQATGFFAAISVILGLLLAAGAMLLTAPERRRFVAELRVQGFSRRQVVAVLMFQAVVLGIAASVVGLLCGVALSRGLFGDSAGYLAQGFTLGTDTKIGTTPVLVALAGGVLACCAAAAPPLFDFRRSRAIDAVFHDHGVPGHSLGAGVRIRLLIAGLLALTVAVATLVLAPNAALLASGLLVLGAVLVMPAALTGTLRAADHLMALLPRMNMLVLALFALRAMRLRSLALAATGAVAVFGSVAIGGAREDLLRGIGQYTSDYVGTADLWVVNDEDNQATSRIAVPNVARLVDAARGVAAARPYYGSFLDAWGRRTWVIARSEADTSMVPASQMVHGDAAQATRRLRSGGWITVTDEIARARGVHVGEMLTIPTPTGDRRLRLAATTTNLGWAPGAMILSATDYRSAWGTQEPSAIEVDLIPGADPAAARREIQRTLPADTSLQIQTAAERASEINHSAREGLDRLSQISLLLILAAVLAMAAATGAAIWQRRVSLAALRIQSVSSRQLWTILLLESGIVLGVGCVVGAATGVIGQLGADRYLGAVTGFPVAPLLASWHPVQTVMFVVLAALAVVAIPGWFASRAPARLGLQE